MFTINGNVKEFTQWEQGYSLTNPNMKAGDKVQFFSGAGDGSVMKAKEVDGAVIVEVPNLMLEHTANITAQLIGGGDHTSFPVKAADKPKDWKRINNEPRKSNAKVEDGVVCDEDGNVVATGTGGGSGGGGTFYVDITMANANADGTSNTTYAEIDEAISNGKDAVARLYIEDQELYLIAPVTIYKPTRYAEFTIITVFVENLVRISIQIYTDGRVIVKKHVLSATEM